MRGVLVKQRDSQPFPARRLANASSFSPDVFCSKLEKWEG